MYVRNTDGVGQTQIGKRLDKYILYIYNIHTYCMHVYYTKVKQGRSNDQEAFYSIYVCTSKLHTSSRAIKRKLVSAKYTYKLKRKTSFPLAASSCPRL